MPYPNNPFPADFNLEILTKFNKTEEGNLYSQNESSVQIQLEKTLKWLCTSPQITTYRVNTIKVDADAVFLMIEKELQKISQIYDIKYCKTFPKEVILIKHKAKAENIPKHLKEVMVDVDCGAAILRGAHIFAPGILGMVAGTEINDQVSVYVDINKKCKKGFQTIFLGQKVFVGNGQVKMTRKELFGEHLTPSGIAVEISVNLSGCPPLEGSFLSMKFALLQNMPSIICVHNLDPKPEDIILDMCASPGNKTTHIAALMKNKGTLIALDKTLHKLKTLQNTCDNFGARVYAFQADSTKILRSEDDRAPERLENGPPFLAETFDKILLDAPCSALGKRPQFLNRSSEKVIQSHVPLQRKLFKVAVSLLKPGGSMTYSTCTITLGENEGIVAWALKNFDCLELVKPNLCVGGHGWPGTSLTHEELTKVQRFGPEDVEYDSVGFFIACFKKSQ